MQRFNALLTIFFLLSMLTSCLEQNRMSKSVSCKEQIFIQYDRQGHKSDASKSNGLVTIIFMNDFNNKIKVYINNTLMFDDLVVTNESTGKSNKGFTYNYNKEEKLPVLKIQKDNNCFDFRIKDRYKFIYVFYNLNKEWIVRFSNKYYVDG